MHAEGATMARKRLTAKERSDFIDWVRYEMHSSEDFGQQVAEHFVDDMDIDTYDTCYRELIYG